MKIKIQILLYFLTTFICSSQNINLYSTLKKCEAKSIKDSLILFDKDNDFKLKLPHKWVGKFSGDLNTLRVNKKVNSTMLTLIGYKFYDVLGDNNNDKKNDSNFLGTIFIESQEIVILTHPEKKKYNERIIHNYEFHCEIENTPWIYLFHLNANRELGKNDVCEIKYIIRQYIMKYKL